MNHREVSDQDKSKELKRTLKGHFPSFKIKINAKIDDEQNS